jgi:hypothetical protein
MLLTIHLRVGTASKKTSRASNIFNIIDSLTLYYLVYYYNYTLTRTTAAMEKRQSARAM